MHFSVAVRYWFQIKANNNLIKTIGVNMLFYFQISMTAILLLTIAQGI